LGAAMSKTAEFRANATECLRMAQIARNERDKQTWLQMAQSWLRRIKYEPRDKAAAARFDTAE